MTIAMKMKEKYNGRNGVITKVLSQKVRVKLLDGPAAGEEKDYTRASLKEKVTPEEEQVPAVTRWWFRVWAVRSKPDGGSEQDLILQVRTARFASASPNPISKPPPVDTREARRKEGARALFGDLPA